MVIFEKLISFFYANVPQVTVSLGVVIFYFFVKYVAGKLINKHTSRNDFAESRKIYVKKLINMALVALMVTVIGAVWEISLKGLSVYFASIFTVIGVGLFANWSIVSNMTASVIIFFFFPYRIGAKIKILDGEPVEGIIRDIALFYVKIETEEGEIYSYPNNLLMQKAVKHVSE